MGARCIEAMSYMTCMSHYSYALWDTLDLLLEDKQTKCRFLQKEGMQLGKQLLILTKYVLDLFAKMVTSAISLHCHVWLRSMDLQHDTRALIEDLSFKGDGLFRDTTDTVWQDHNKSIKASRTLGVSASLMGSKPSQWSRFWSRYQYASAIPRPIVALKIPSIP